MWHDNISSKQLVFIKFTAAQIGFKDGAFLDTYLNNLARLAHDSRHLGAVPHEEFMTERRNNLENQAAKGVLNPRTPPWLDPTNFDDTGTHYIPKSFKITDYLRAEVDNKKKFAFKKKALNLDTISATDLANFTFCPASYAIAKTFETDTLESAAIGTSFHEGKRLLPRPLKERGEDREKQSASWRNEENRAFFDAIKDAVALFSGHDGSKKFFRSTKGNFIGQPDYIFRKQNGSVFIVEEKFKYLSQEQSEQLSTTPKYGIYFSDNHKVQLASYIYGLDEFQAQEGYLVYWLYQVGDDDAWIADCLVHHIPKSPKTQEFLRKQYLDLLNFQQSQKLGFEPARLKANKCARCVVNRFCGHKTGRFDELELPYHQKYLKLVSTLFPEELKKLPVVPPTDAPSKASVN